MPYCKVTNLKKSNLHECNGIFQFFRSAVKMMSNLTENDVWLEGDEEDKVDIPEILWHLV